MPADVKHRQGRQRAVRLDRRTRAARAQGREARDELLAAALQVFYRKQVAYPKSLEQLPAESRPPMNDRFGKPWNYQLTGFAKLTGFPIWIAVAKVLPAVIGWRSANPSR